MRVVSLAGQKAEGDDFGGVVWVVYYIKGWNWLLLSTNTVPVDARKKRVRH